MLQRCDQASAVWQLMQGNTGAKVLQDAWLRSKGRLQAYGQSRITLTQNEHCQTFAAGMYAEGERRSGRTETDGNFDSP